MFYLVRRLSKVFFQNQRSIAKVLEPFEPFELLNILNQLRLGLRLAYEVCYRYRLKRVIVIVSVEIFCNTSLAER